MKLAIIAACSRNRVIGKDNSLPWHLPEDLAHFKATTMGKPLIMGRKTFESIGRPLPGRKTLVVTRQSEWSVEGVEVYHSLQAAIDRARDLVDPATGEVMVAGGADIYRQCLPLADTLYLTEVDLEVAGDAFFPPLDERQWRCRHRQRHLSPKSGLGFEFVRWERR